MTTETQLSEWKRQWRHLLSERLGSAFESIEAYLPPASPKADSLLLLKAELNEANRAKVMGIKSGEALQLDYNRIRLRLLEWIDGLEVADFSPPTGGFRLDGRGVLLHKIPRQMEIGREEVCVIRLAFDRAVIADNLELTEEVEVREVTVSEIMEAELIDPNREPAFHIRTYHDERQFLEAGAYTEWKFYVEPIREGTFRLLLKLTVIEEIMGERERRNITWEEQVQIVADRQESEPVSFSAAGIALASGLEISEATRPRGLQPDVPGAPQERVLDRVGDTVLPGGPPSPAPVKPEAASPKSPSLRRRLSIAASIVLIVGVGGLYWFAQEPAGVVPSVSKPGERFPAPPSDNEVKPEESIPSPSDQPAKSEELPSNIRLSPILQQRGPTYAPPLPAGFETELYFNICLDAGGKVTTVKPLNGGAAPEAWQQQAVKTLKAWTFESAPGETCGLVLFRPE